MNLIKEILKFLVNTYEIIRIVSLIILLAMLPLLKNNHIILAITMIPVSILLIYLAVNDNKVIFKIKSKKILIKKIFRITMDILIIALCFVYFYNSIISFMTFFAE